ncbi:MULTISPECIES: imidazole glycerol phosphate synthase subunit HisH [unclassified Bradyrhizobium]
MNITIVNYGVGNPGALVNMFEFIGYEAWITDKPQTIVQASHLVLPGVGAFDAAMQRLRESRLIHTLEKAAFGLKIPFLGVCLGMQLLGRRSEEGTSAGLGWIPADAVRMCPDPTLKLKVPFMGWADVEATPRAKLFNKDDENRYYFSHSYRVQCDDHDDVAATYEFDGPIACAVQRENIYGVQFHPEKSHRFGMRLLRNFVERTSK